MKYDLTHRVFISETLKRAINQLIDNVPPEINYFRRDNFFVLLSLIKEIPARNKREGLTVDGFTKLHSTLLRQYVHDYNKYLDYLIKHEIIETDAHYIPGKKSRGYRIAKQYRSRVNCSRIKNPSLGRRLKMVQQDVPYKYKALFKHLNGLEIDYNNASDFTKKLLNHRMKYPEARAWDKQKKRYKNPLNQYESAFINIHYLNDKSFYFFVDDNVHRLHTNITNMQSSLRNYLTWKGHKLASVDISNSQPYLSCLLFSPAFYDNANTNRKVGRPLKQKDQLNLLSFPQILAQLKSKFSKDPNFLSNFLMLSNIPSNFSLSNMVIGDTTTLATQETGYNTVPNSMQDIALFINLVKNGEFYEYLAKQYNEKLDMSFYDRKNIKVEVLQVLFTDNRFIGQREAASKRIFKAVFPNVYKLFSLFKRGDASLFPRLLQQIEARLILDVICKRITGEKPRIPILTIHDSIATTLPNVDYVKGVMTDELTKYIGIPPNLKVEYWEESNVVNKYPELFPERRLKLQA